MLNALLGSFTPAADRIGILFEHLLHSQISALVTGRDAEIRVSSYRTEHGAEVDLILEGDGVLWAVECKASRNVGPSDCLGLARFSEFYGKSHRSVIAYLGDVKRRIADVDVLPWQELMRELDRKIGRA